MKITQILLFCIQSSPLSETSSLSPPYLSLLPSKPLYSTVTGQASHSLQLAFCLSSQIPKITLLAPLSPIPVITEDHTHVSYPPQSLSWGHRGSVPFSSEVSLNFLCIYFTGKSLLYFIIINMYFLPPLLDFQLFENLENILFSLCSP